jgi:hypothetical protein
MLRVLAPVMVCLALVACSPAEDPARTALRERLALEATLSPEELGRLRAEVTRAMAGKTFRARQGETTRPLDTEQQMVVFGMLSDPAGMFDEGVRTENGTIFRVLNAPGHSSNAEIETIRRLWIEVETLLPGRFQFNYAFPNPEDYTLELLEQLGQ